MKCLVEETVVKRDRNLVHRWDFVKVQTMVPRLVY